MNRISWKHNNLLISYSHPLITPYRDTSVPLSSINEAMYLYYEVTLISGNKTIMKFSIWDNPKVQLLPELIEEIINYDMDKAYVMERNSKSCVRYHQISIEDPFDTEYFYKLERTDTEDHTSDGNENCTSFYTLSIGQMERCKKYGGSNREEYGSAVVIKYMTSADLTRLRKTALDFVDGAVKAYNNELQEEN